jgi:PadR family transcriptional regulator AphA
MLNRDSSMKAGSRTRFLILGLLCEGPLSGYDIARLTRLRFRFFWSESYGQIYPELRRLSAEGLIAELHPTGGPRGKRSWSLTGAGGVALRSWLAEKGASDSARLETLLKAYFAFAGAPGTLSSVLGNFRDKLALDIDGLEKEEKQLRDAPDPHLDHRYALMTLELGLLTYRTWKDWAERWAGEGPRSGAGIPLKAPGTSPSGAGPSPSPP